jgi:hypothetical protein
MGGKHLRVHLAQIGAVGNAVVADSRLLQHHSHDIHVPGGIAGGELPCPGGVVVQATDRHAPRDARILQEALEGRPGRSHHFADRPAATARMHGLADAARIETDEVVVRPHVRTQHIAEQIHRVEPARARAAGIREQHAAPVRRVGGRNP